MKHIILLNLLFFSLLTLPGKAFSLHCGAILGSERTLHIFNDFEISPVEVGGVLNTDAKARINLASHYKGKWLILDISASWCPYCKLDQFFFSALTNKPNEEHTGRKDLWSKPEVEVLQAHLFVEFQKDGVYGQSFDGIKNFLSDENLSVDDILKDTDRSGIDSFFVNVDHPHSFTKAVDSNDGNAILPDFTGFPHQLVINPDGEIIFNGSFTSSRPEDGGSWSLAYQRHYKMIEEQIAEYERR